MGAFEIVFHTAATKDFASLVLQDQRRIKTAIETKLRTSPFSYGVPLHANLKGFYKLRVGDSRVVFRIHGETVQIFCIGLRKNVYEKMGTRVTKE